MSFEAVPADVERVATDAIGAAIEVHRHLGPGLLERIYQDALCFEMTLRKIPHPSWPTLCVLCGQPFVS